MIRNDIVGRIRYEIAVKTKLHFLSKYLALILYKYIYIYVLYVV